MNKIFGLKHIIIVFVSILLIVGLFIFSRKIRFEILCKILFVVGIVSEIVKILYYTVANEDKLGGFLPKTDLPFQLCSIQIIFFTIIVIFKNEKINRFLFSFMMPSCLLGGFAAILIPTTSSLNTWVITFQYFIFHIALIVFALRLMTSKELNLTIKDYFNCLKFLLVLFFFAIYINSIVYDGNDKINFMYVVGPPQKGLPYLNEDSGWLVYIIRYAILVIGCVTACYIKPIIMAIKNKLKKEKIEDTNN